MLGSLAWLQTQKGDLVKVIKKLYNSPVCSIHLLTTINLFALWVSMRIQIPLLCLRWERFAPGPVLPVTVAPAKKVQDPDPPPKKRGRPPKDPSQPPKKRGRPPKNPAQETPEDPFVEQSKVASAAIPPAPEALDIKAASEPGSPMQDPPKPESVVENLEPLPTPPSRATFAGRTRLGSETYQKQWDERRAKYYQVVPASHWKDGLERDYWTLCTKTGSLDEAMVQFLAKIGVDQVVPTPSAHAAAPVRRPRPKPSDQPQAKAKAKAKAKVKSGPSNGRGRGAGRGRANARRIVCR